MLWGLKPVEQKAAHGLTLERIKRFVHLGLLLPGERMPSERRMAEQFSISRVTLREALSVLEAEGYVTIRRGAKGGAFVAEEPDLRHMAENQMSADPAAALRVFEYRDIAEPMAAKLAAVRRTLGDLKKVEDSVARLRDAQTLGEVRRSETTFHLLVAQASGNRYIATSVEEALAALFLPLPKGDVSAIRQNSFEIRAAILEAIRHRAEARARQHMAEAILQDKSRVPAQKVA